MQDLLNRDDEELARAIELQPRITSAQELSDETLWAIEPCRERPPEVLAAPTEYHLPERDEFRSFRRKVLALYHRVLLRLLPGSRRLRVGQHQQALQRIWEAEEQYHWLVNARDKVLGPAVECLKQKNQATADYVKELTRGIEGARSQLQQLRTRVRELALERQALLEDLADPGLAGTLVARVGQDSLQTALAEARGTTRSIAEEIARCFREVQFVEDQLEFYEEVLVRSRSTLRRFDGLIEGAMKQWRDISRTIEVYERPTRDEAGATIAIAILDEVETVTDDLKESIEAINLNFHSVAESYATAAKVREYSSPVPVDIGELSFDEEEPPLPAARPRTEHEEA